jgi:ABC-type bacteriocin/lantibiotic exporter with double-glycine peptidase domain
MIIANQHLETLTVNPVKEINRMAPLKKVVYNDTIRIENLDVYIEDQHILKDINLAIPEKSITCIIGPSGCGKTTFLKTLNRMHVSMSSIPVRKWGCWLSVHALSQCRYLTMLLTAREFME